MVGEADMFHLVSAVGRRGELGIIVFTHVGESSIVSRYLPGKAQKANKTFDFLLCGGFE